MHPLIGEARSRPGAQRQLVAKLLNRPLAAVAFRYGCTKELPVALDEQGQPRVAIVRHLITGTKCFADAIEPPGRVYALVCCLCLNLDAQPEPPYEDPVEHIGNVPRHDTKRKASPHTHARAATRARGDLALMHLLAMRLWVWKPLMTSPRLLSDNALRLR